MRIATGELAEMAGWAQYDTGNHDAATALYGEALTHARLADSPELEATTLASMALLALNRDRPREAAAICAAARRLADRLGSDRLHSLIWSREARAYAELGDGKVSGQALGHASRHLERAHGSGEQWEIWLDFHDAAELSSAAGLTFNALGNHSAAIKHFRRALDVQGAAYVRNRGMYLTSLADALLTGQHVDEAVVVADSAHVQLLLVSSGRARARHAALRERLARTGSRAAGDAALRWGTD